MTATLPPSGARRARTAAHVLPVLAVLAAATVGTSGPAAAAPVPATAATRPATAVTLAPTAPAAVPATTAPARAATDGAGDPAPSNRGLRTPEAASKNLWDAWRDDDRPRALLYASATAVRTLFSRRWDAEVRNQGCGRANGTARCLYTEGPLAYVVTVSGSRTAGYRVQRVDLLGRDAATASLDPTATTAATRTSTSPAGTSSGSGSSASEPSGRTADRTTDRTPATLATGSAGAAVRRADAPTPVAAASGPVGQVREGDDR